MRPQDNIPTERIIHYIVKDYQRMYNGFHAMRESKDAYIDELLKKIGRKTKAISNLQAENKCLRAKLKEVRESRERLTEAKDAESESLREQLNVANKKVKLLAQAIDNPDILKNEHILRSDEDKAWMNKAMKQLDKALMDFVSVQARLGETGDAMKEALPTTENTERVYRRFGKVFPKIESCICHIEDFLAKAGNIKIEQ